jgi:hypothetical protein
MNAGTNGGMNYAPAVITEITDPEGPNGGVVCNIQRFGNTSLSVLGFVTDVEVVDYEADARSLGVGAGAWPMDYA